MLHTYIYLSMMLHVTYLPDFGTNRDQSVVCSVFILYAKYLAKILCIVRLQNTQCSETGPKRHCSGPEQYQYPFRYYLYS